MYDGAFPVPQSSSNIAQFMPPGAFQEPFFSRHPLSFKTLRTEASGGKNEEQTMVV
jgi:hypothetical protein